MTIQGIKTRFIQNMTYIVMGMFVYCSQSEQGKKDNHGM